MNINNFEKEIKRKTKGQKQATIPKKNKSARGELFHFQKRDLLFIIVAAKWNYIKIGVNTNLITVSDDNLLGNDFISNFARSSRRDIES